MWEGKVIGYDERSVCEKRMGWYAKVHVCVRIN